MRRLVSLLALALALVATDASAASAASLYYSLPSSGGYLADTGQANAVFDFAHSATSVSASIQYLDAGLAPVSATTAVPIHFVLQDGAHDRWLPNAPLPSIPLADGSYVIRYTLVEDGATVVVDVPFTLTQDRPTAPVASFTTSWNQPTRVTWTISTFAVVPLLYYTFATDASPNDSICFGQARVCDVPAADHAIRYHVRAFNYPSQATDSASIEIPASVDLDAPTAPSITTTSPQMLAALRLAFTAASDAISGVDHYLVRRYAGAPAEGACSGGTPATTTVPAPATTADVAAPDGTWCVTVTAVDAAGNASAASAPIEVAIDATPPTPAAFATDHHVTQGAPALAWTAPTSADLAGYVLRRYGGAPVDGACTGTATREVTTTATSFVDEDSLADGSYCYALETRDVVGNAATSAAIHVVVDTTAPSAPVLTPLRALSAHPALDIAPSNDATGLGVAAYRIFQDGTHVGTVLATADPLRATVSPVPEDGAHSYLAVAEDAAGNLSTPSEAVTITVDTTVPEAPILTSMDAVVTAGPSLVWTAMPGADAYRIERDGVQIAETTAATTTFVDDADLPDATYAYTVRTVGANGEASAASSSASVTVAATPPSSLAELTLWATVPSPSLAWAATEGAATYVVRRNGTAVGTTTATTWTDGTLPDGRYRYDVMAYSVSGVPAAAASPALDVVLDTTPPGAFAISAARPLTAVAPRIAIAAAADANGVGSYDVRRATSPTGAWTELGRVAADAVPLAYADDGGLPDGTYWYDVVAVDVYGNRRSANAPVAITVDSVAPAVPTALVADASATASAPRLSWGAVAAAARYALYRDDELIDDDVTGTRFTDEALAREGEHRYAVRCRTERRHVHIVHLRRRDARPHPADRADRPRRAHGCGGPDAPHVVGRDGCRERRRELPDPPRRPGRRHEPGAGLRRPDRRAGGRRRRPLRRRRDRSRGQRLAAVRGGRRRARRRHGPDRRARRTDVQPRVLRTGARDRRALPPPARHGDGRRRRHVARGLARRHPAGEPLHRPRRALGARRDAMCRGPHRVPSPAPERRRMVAHRVRGDAARRLPAAPPRTGRSRQRDRREPARVPRHAPALRRCGLASALSRRAAPARRPC